ncbi:hypothetical protein [Dehalococcoides mccartyi]|uniref:hypothetical protein n=1 Tax=Dehalococcoides mccartyi TaxID=61435 RepID=UPI001AF1DF82|nr:hypothetical protein [Dehalococcoides mccartyi]BCT55300.1 hypothetical protein DHCNIT_000630 [Dehalococcoides mccartyi]
MNIWTDLDWQAIGTWFTGAALVVFAWLTWKIQRQQHKLLYGGPRLRVDYSETAVSSFSGNRSYWVHVQVGNRAGTSNSVVECNWDIIVPQNAGPPVHLVLPSQKFSELQASQLPSNVKGHFLIAPFRVEAFDTIDGWLHRCVSEEALNHQTPEQIALVFIDSSGVQYPISVRTSFPVDNIEPHTH